MAKPETKYCALFLAVVLYLEGRGINNLSLRPGVFEFHTDVFNGYGPFLCKLNPHSEEIDKVPPYHLTICQPEYFPGIAACVSPVDGGVLSPYQEDDLIRHFRDLTPPDIGDSELRAEFDYLYA